MRRRIVCCIMAALYMLPFAGASAETLRMSHQEEIKAAILIEVQTGTVLWELNGAEPYPVAGLSKLPAIVTLAQSMDDGSVQADLHVCVSDRAAAVTGPTAFLEQGETIDVSELMKAAVMISAGDAITALGETVYGSESVFVDNINVTLEQLETASTVTESLGAGATLCARDLARIAAAAAGSETFCKYACLYLDGIMHEDGRETELVNANRLLNNYSGCSGLLTGSSQQDGYCGAFLVERNDTSLIAVIIGAETAAIRAAAAVELLDYGFANYRFTILARKGQTFAESVPVRNGTLRSVDLLVTEDASLIADAQAGSISEKLLIPDCLEAPFTVDDPLGSVEFIAADGSAVASVPLYASASVEAFGIKDILKKIMLCFIGFIP